jgi:hypothetical protein
VKRHVREHRGDGRDNAADLIDLGATADGTYSDSKLDSPAVIDGRKLIDDVGEIHGMAEVVVDRAPLQHWRPGPGYVQKGVKNVDDGLGGLLLSSADVSRSVKLLCGSIGDHSPGNWRADARDPVSQLLRREVVHAVASEPGERTSVHRYRSVPHREAGRALQLIVPSLERGNR